MTWADLWVSGILDIFVAGLGDEKRLEFVRIRIGPAIARVEYRGDRRWRMRARILDKYSAGWCGVHELRIRQAERYNDDKLSQEAHGTPDVFPQINLAIDKLFRGC